MSVDIVARGLAAQNRISLPRQLGGNRLVNLHRQVPNPVRLAIFGNSIVAGVNSRNILWSAVRLAGKFQVAANYGVAGNTSTQMLARVNDVVNCDGVLLLEGPNDAGAAASARVHMDNYRAMIENFLARGIVPAIVASTPHNTANGVGRVGAYLWAEMLLAEEYGIDFLDPWIGLVDPATGYWAAGNSDDAIHPNAAASDTLIPILASLLAGTTGTELWVPRASVADPDGYLMTGGNQLFTATGGSSPTKTFTNWSAIGATPPNYDAVAAPTGHRGNFCQMTTNAAGGNPYMRKRMSGLHQAGDRLLVSVAVSHAYTANSVLTATLSGGGGMTGGASGAGEVTGTLSYSHALTRYVGSFVATTTADIDLTIQVGNAGTAGGVTQFGEIEILNLTKLRKR